MAKDKEWLLYVAVGILAYAVFFAPETATTVVNGGGNGGGVDIDFCDVVEPSASFTGQRMFLAGTALTGESVRVIKNNGDGTMKDLGQVMLSSGTLNTAPGGRYKLYFGENSTVYYTDTQEYTVPCQDAVDDKTGILCTIDTTPTITIYNDDGDPMAATAAAAIVSSTGNQSTTTDEEKTLKVKIEPSSDQCYGNPGIGGKNALCFVYNTTVFNNIKMDVAGADTPYIIQNNLSAGWSVKCYGFDTVADNGKVELPFTYERTSTTLVPDGESSLKIVIDDIAFDLDADTLGEIMGYEDEDNNELGTTSSTTAHVMFTQG